MFRLRLNLGRLAIICTAHGALAIGCGSGSNSADDEGTGGIAGSGDGTATGGQAASGGSSAGGNPGAGGDSGSGNPGAGGTTQEPATYPPVTCDPVPAACPTNVFDGDVTIDNLSPGTDFEGVTEITGSLDIDASAGLEGLDCLVTVRGDLSVSLQSGGSFENALPRLAFVGESVDLRVGNFADPVLFDCALPSLASIGTLLLFSGNLDADGPLAGELNLSKLETFSSIRIDGTELERIVLPDDLSMSVSQLQVNNNRSLVELLGFDNMNLLGDPDPISYSLWIVNNRLLSSCRANEFGELFEEAGYATDSIHVRDNASCP